MMKNLGRSIIGWIKERVKGAPRFLNGNLKYLLVLAVFFLVIFLDIMSKEQEKEKKLKGKSDIYESYWETNDPDLSSKEPIKIYEDILTAGEGDYYRLGFVARSLLNEKLEVVIRSFSGEEVKVGEINIEGAIDSDDYYEVVFEADGGYKDLILKVIKDEAESDVFIINSKSSKDGIFISDVSLDRLDIKSDEEKKNLGVTVFGKVNMKKSSLFVDAKKKPSSGKGKWELLDSFKAEGDRLVYIDVALDNVKYDSDNKYRLILGECGQGNEINKNGIISEIKFSSSNLKQYYLDNNIYRFEIAKKLKKNDNYCIQIKKEKGRAEGDLVLGSVDDNNKNGAAMTLTLFDYSYDERGEVLLSNSRISDNGKELFYVYKNNGFVADFFDVFEGGGKFYYDWKKKEVVASEKKESYFVYKFDIGHPFRSMRIEAEQLDNDVDQMGIEYSFDRENWIDIDYSQENNESQKFDYVIKNGNEFEIVYVKVYFRGSQESSKRAFGVKDFRVSAIAER